MLDVVIKSKQTFGKSREKHKAQYVSRVSPGAYMNVVLNVNHTSGLFTNI